jgi:hypothetical protein
MARVAKTGAPVIIADEMPDFLDIAEIGRRVLNNSRHEVIWRGGGYLMHGDAPEKSVRTASDAVSAAARARPRRLPSRGVQSCPRS